MITRRKRVNTGIDIEQLEELAAVIVTADWGPKFTVIHHLTKRGKSEASKSIELERSDQKDSTN